MKKLFVAVGVFFYWLWKFLSQVSLLITSLFFILVVVFFIALFFRPGVKVPQGAALVISPTGRLVEKTTVINPLARFINEIVGVPVREETSLQDVLDAINAAAKDQRIKLLVLSLSGLNQAGLNQLQTIGHAIENFKKSGKKVIAVGDQYSQGQYYLASYADKIYMNPMGAVGLQGFGVYRLYMKKLLDKLAVNFHVFKVGTYKSALEPFTRNNMSAAAKDANRFWLARFWNSYCADIAKHRGLTMEKINDYINEMPRYMRRAGGDSGRMALDAGLVDGLKTSQETEDYLSSLVGRSDDGSSFKQIQLTDYLTTIIPSYVGRDSSVKDRIGLIVARGDIVYDKNIPGQIDSAALCKRISRAGRDKRIKALVLRIDSGGGSAFASEAIRQALLQVRKAGKPVVVSMGSMAASGAYWLSADANRIFASPFTLTGSIGIFGVLPTFEGSLAKIGVFSDGTGTTRIAGAGNPLRPLAPELQDTIQQSVEEGYNRFLSVVAKGRGLSRAKVAELAQGRVWDGATALKLGLVDKLGSLHDAVIAAAKLAGLSKYEAVYIRPELSPGQQLLQKLAQRASVLFEHSRFAGVGGGSMVREAVRERFLDFSLLADDPEHMYARCLIPRSAIVF